MTKKGVGNGAFLIAKICLKKVFWAICRKCVLSGFAMEKSLKMAVFVKFFARRSKKHKHLWLENQPFIYKKLIKTKNRILKQKKVVAKSL